MRKEIRKLLEEKRQNMRKMGAFSKYCSNCGQTFGSDDINVFLKMVEEHKCRSKK